MQKNQIKTSRFRRASEYTGQCVLKLGAEFMYELFGQQYLSTVSKAGRTIQNQERGASETRQEITTS